MPREVFCLTDWSIIVTNGEKTCERSGQCFLINTNMLFTPKDFFSSPGHWPGLDCNRQFCMYVCMIVCVCVSGSSAAHRQDRAKSK